MLGTQIPMISKFATVCLVLAIILMPHAHTRAADKPAALRAQIEQAIAKVKPALVRIRVVSTEYREGREVKMQEVGSGAIISADGFLITNHHVAGHAARMFCTLWNREEIEAELIGTDPLTDISILKLHPDKPRKFDFVTFGDSSVMRVGDSVLAMGSPMALSQSVTLGILSNTEMVMPRFFGGSDSFRLDGESVGALVRWFAHDAAIYGGNSGGPLVNLKGEIIGINEISFGLSGAIPGNLAKDVAKQIITAGKVERSWLGLDAQPIFKSDKDEHGILIGGVVEDSPADRGGIKAGDLLVKLNGTPVDVHFDEQLPEFMSLISGLPINKSVPAVVRRDGKELTIHVTTAEREKIFPQQHEIKQWGLVARNFSFLLSKEYKRANTNGALVSSVRPGGASGDAKPAIQYGDVLVKVNETPINNVEDLMLVTKEITKGKTQPVPVMAIFERRAQRFMTVVRVGLEDLKDPGLEVSKAWLPVQTHVISREIAKQLSQPDLRGFYITRVYPGSTAEKAGLLAGDFIVALDGDKLTATGPEHEDELNSLIRQYDIGKSAELGILRDGKSLKVNVELVRSPRLEREMKKYLNSEFEFTTRDVCFFDAADAQWQGNQSGALVDEVKPGSWAELGGLYVGDLILEMDHQPVTDVDSLRKIMEHIAATRPGTIVVKVLRGIQTNYLEFEPNWKN